MATSARPEELNSLLQTLPNRPMTARLVMEDKTFAELFKEAHLKQKNDTSWIFVGQDTRAIER